MVEFGFVGFVGCCFRYWRKVIGLVMGCEVVIEFKISSRVIISNFFMFCVVWEF